MNTTHTSNTPFQENATFAQRYAFLRNRRGPFCLGLDPTPGLLKAWGLKDSIDDLRSFCLTTLEAASDQLTTIKPQSAYFERFGSKGIAVLEECMAAIRERHTLALLDVKRGDIGSTNQAYAQAYLGPESALKADAITVHPYLGFDALGPIMTHAVDSRTGIFVVVLSSNPEGETIQQARVTSDTTVVQSLCHAISAYNQSNCPDGVGPIGAVVGITAKTVSETVERLERSLILAPGLGAQGGEFAHVSKLFSKCKSRVLPISSRAVLSQGPDVKRLRESIKAHCGQAWEALA
jgi:orotidine-5'-phosphate decarboxylase